VFLYRFGDLHAFAFRHRDPAVAREADGHGLFVVVLEDELDVLDLN
jgi:hypothetical protein